MLKRIVGTVKRLAQRQDRDKRRSTTTRVTDAIPDDVIADATYATTDAVSDNISSNAIPDDAVADFSSLVLPKRPERASARAGAAPTRPPSAAVSTAVRPPRPHPCERRGKGRARLNKPARPRGRTAGAPLGARGLSLSLIHI